MHKFIKKLLPVGLLACTLTVATLSPLTAHANNSPSDNQIAETSIVTETETEAETETRKEQETEMFPNTEIETETQTEPESEFETESESETTPTPVAPSEPDTAPESTQPDTPTDTALDTSIEESTETITEITVNALDDEIRTLLYNYLVKATVLVDHLNAEAQDETEETTSYEEENAELLNQYLTAQLGETEEETEATAETETETELETETETETEMETETLSLSDNNIEEDIYTSVENIHKELKDTKALTTALLFSILSGIGILTGVTIFRRFK